MSDTRRIRDLLPDITVVPWDLASTGAALPGVATAFDACLHLAWRGISGSGGSEAENRRSLEASIALARYVSSIGCRRFVGVGTGLEYRESTERHGENDDVAPRGAYASAKAAFLEFLRPFCEDHGLDLAWVRLFHVYGPDDDPRRFIPWLIRTLASGEPAAMTAGEQRRDYLHVEDAADALWSITKGSLTGPVNAASGTAVKLADVAQTIAHMLDRESLLRAGALPYRPKEHMAVLADPSRLFATGWRPQMDLTTGLANTVGWWRSC